MGNAIAIVGAPGTGKTSGLATLNPTETYYINSDAKPLTFIGGNKLYNENTGNYKSKSRNEDGTMVSLTLEDIYKSVIVLSTNIKFKHIKNVVIDTVNTAINDFELLPEKNLKLQEWMDLAKGVYKIIKILQDNVRQDLTIFCLFHEEIVDGIRNIKTPGKKLESLTIAGFFNTCLFASVRKVGNENEHYLITKNNGTSVAKSYKGCFEPEIPIDYQFIKDKIEAWFNL